MDGTICGSQPVGTEKSRRTLPPALTRRPCTTQADSAPGRPAGPADSGGDVLPVPIRRPRPDSGFGGLAPAAVIACRLAQLHRVRDLYRVIYYHTTDLGGRQEGNCTKWGQKKHRMSGGGIRTLGERRHARFQRASGDCPPGSSGCYRTEKLFSIAPPAPGPPHPAPAPRIHWS